MMSVRTMTDRPTVGGGDFAPTTLATRNQQRTHPRIRTAFPTFPRLVVSVVIASSSFWKAASHSSVAIAAASSAEEAPVTGRRAPEAEAAVAVRRETAAPQTMERTAAVTAALRVVDTILQVRPPLTFLRGVSSKRGLGERVGSGAAFVAFAVGCGCLVAGIGSAASALRCRRGVLVSLLGAVFGAFFVWASFLVGCGFGRTVHALPRLRSVRSPKSGAGPQRGDDGPKATKVDPCAHGHSSSIATIRRQRSTRKSGKAALGRHSLAVCENQHWLSHCPFMPDKNRSGIKCSCNGLFQSHYCN
jgi:hypothetical protein